MDKVERIKMVKAMEFITRNLNDMDLFDEWLLDGVADGDIEYGYMTVNSSEDFEKLDYYIEDENFSTLMGLFCDMIAKATRSGGLYCDGVVSFGEYDYRMQNQSK